MNYDILLSFIVASMALTIAPGPDIIYVLMQSLSNGKKYGLITSLGLVSGILIHTSLVAFGIAAIIKKSETAFLCIKIAGALYLLYLAYKTYKSNDTPLPENRTLPKQKLSALYAQGFLMNIINPKVTLFFLAFFPNFLFSATLSHRNQFFILGLLFILQALSIFSIVSLWAGAMARYLIKRRNAGKVMKYLQIIVFISIALFILIP
jgi:threonine/homoserine/homoserine lactone efflux protein